MLAWRVLRRARAAALDGRELVRNLYKMGVLGADRRAHRVLRRRHHVIQSGTS